MNTRKLASTLATGALILFGSSLLSACADSFVADGPEMTVESTEFQPGKQIERYFLPPPPGGGTTSSSSTGTASDSTSTK